ncbi:DUF4329 domain-containing protein [Escherichia coli]
MRSWKTGKVPFRTLLVYKSQGTDRVAAYHTHGADSHGDYVDEFFSSSDKNLVRSKDNNLEAFYLATPDGRFEALNNKGEYIFIRNSVPGLSSVCIPYHD